MAREPRSITIALSVAQLDRLGVPDDMDDDALAEALDQALLEDDGVFRMMVEEWIEKEAQDHD